jgi:prepilin-type N-terminal cleavage/methylation domain-containing protein
MNARRCKGFTLVEIVVATVVLSLVAVGFFATFLSARYLVERSKRRLKAMEIARERIEVMRREVRADWWYSGNASDPLLPNGTWTGWNSAMHTGYSVRYKVDPGPVNTEYRKVTVQVRCD